VKYIFKEEFGEDLTDAEGNEMASRLLQLYAALAEPTPDELKELGLDEMPDLGL
jgi:hypothetical protein